MTKYLIVKQYSEGFISPLIVVGDKLQACRIAKDANNHMHLDEDSAYRVMVLPIKEFGQSMDFGESICDGYLEVIHKLTKK